MAKGDIATFRIENIAATGSGLARAEGRCIFAEFTAPGELVNLRITEEQKSWAKAELLELLEPSPQRIEPLCPLYRVCGGCNFQHLGYEAQIVAKESILRESFARIGALSLAELPEIRVLASIMPWEYRNRVQFHCLPDNRKIPGFREKNGKNIIPLADCPVADPGIRAALKDPQKSRLVPPPEKDRFTVYSKGDLFLSEGGNSRGKIFIGENESQELSIDAGVFFQSNFQMLELLLEDLKALAAKCDSDLPLGDIYCGVGTFSSFLGDRFGQAELVEENKAALDLARKNVRIKDSRFYCLNADNWIKRRKTFDRPWGLLIVDPPRTGLSGPLRRFLATAKAETLAYVSCDPVTLARDSKDITGSGFELKELTLYDFYPQTAHIESLAVFHKKQ
jgi:23S rRNA (uracil1939-C5)-methyltransferase